MNDPDAPRPWLMLYARAIDAALRAIAFVMDTRVIRNNGRLQRWLDARERRLDEDEDEG
jgi:hypothetical protein